ncbi:MAG: DUF4129 domain-containing protein [Vulcanisaeta sp.]|uniref:DUF4129 domain-containing protein n=1 Tax=Vulcanisaeta sp. TaxID=2020871 RepID=UPI003D130236
MRVLYLALVSMLIIAITIYLSHVIPGIATIPNPLNERLRVDITDALELYITALGLNALGNYTGAMYILHALNATSAVKASQLLGELHAHEVMLTDYMVRLESVYNEVLELASTGNYSGARYFALEGLILDSEANKELSQILSIITTVAPNETGRAMSMAEEVRARLISMNNTFLGVLANNLIATNLTITVEPNETTVGGITMVFGRLLAENGSAMPNATIVIYVDGELAGSAITNSMGYYETAITIPYIYTANTQVMAVYNPPPGSRYLPSRATANITLLFNETALSINYTGSVLWGEPIIISGFVSGPPSREVLVSIGGINESITTVNNVFNVSISTRDLKPGNYTVFVYVEPNGTYAPTSYGGTVSINALLASPSITYSGSVIAGFPVIVSGSVSPWVSNLTITVSLAGSAITLNLTSPNFTVEIPTSILLGMGRHSITIAISPRPPIAPGHYYYSVFVINPLEIALPAVIILAPILMVRAGILRVRRSMGVGVGTQDLQVPSTSIAVVIGGGKPTTRVEEVERRIVSSAPTGKISIGSVREIVRAMAQAISSVSRKTGVEFRATNTLREYLRSVSSKLSPEEYTALAELTGLTEYALYSPYAPTENDVARAWELARVLPQ